MTYFFSVSCDRTFHKRCKEHFGNLSGTIVELLTKEMDRRDEEVRLKTAHREWVMKNVYPTFKKVVGKSDPFSFYNNPDRAVTTLKERGIEAQPDDIKDCISIMIKEENP